MGKVKLFIEVRSWVSWRNKQLRSSRESGSTGSGSPRRVCRIRSKSLIQPGEIRIRSGESNQASGHSFGNVGQPVGPDRLGMSFGRWVMTPSRAIREPLDRP